MEYLVSKMLDCAKGLQGALQQNEKNSIRYWQSRIANTWEEIKGAAGPSWETVAEEICATVKDENGYNLRPPSDNRIIICEVCHNEVASGTICTLYHDGAGVMEWEAACADCGQAAKEKTNALIDKYGGGKFRYRCWYPEFVADTNTGWNRFNEMYNEARWAGWSEVVDE